MFKDILFVFSSLSPNKPAPNHWWIMLTHKGKYIKHEAPFIIQWLYAKYCNKKIIVSSWKKKNPNKFFFFFQRITIVMEKQDNESFGFDIQVSMTHKNKWCTVCIVVVLLNRPFQSFTWKNIISSCRPMAWSWKTALQWRCALLCVTCRRTVLLRVQAWPQVIHQHLLNEPTCFLHLQHHQTWLNTTLVNLKIDRYTTDVNVMRQHIHAHTFWCNTQPRCLPITDESPLWFIAGDIIVTINGASIEGYSHQHILDLIRESTNSLKWVTETTWWQHNKAQPRRNYPEIKAAQCLCAFCWRCMYLHVTVWLQDGDCVWECREADRAGEAGDPA